MLDALGFNAPKSSRKIYSKQEMLRRFKRYTELDFTVWKEREVVNFVELFITADDCPRNAEYKSSLAPESLKPTQRKPDDTPM